MTLFDEARRQLDICNACRYCEGYCAVYPALERRIDFTVGDLGHLAELCHDCRACFYACMYASPHEFAINPPRVLAELRRTHRRELLPLGRLAPTWRALVVVATMSALLLAVIGTTRGLHSLIAAHRRPASPYAIVPYPALLAIGLASAGVAVGLFAVALVRYGRRAGPSPDGSSFLAALLRAAHDAATLKYLKSAGVECTYPSERPSALRRRFHSALAGGFVLLLASTVSAGISQDLLASQPPYAVVSVPVILGILGAAAMALGGGGLLALKPRADLEPGDPETARADRALLVVLLVLVVTGLLTLVCRNTTAYGVFLALHLDAVFSSFLLAPFTKFGHVVFRFAALVRDEEERAAEGL